MTQTMKRLAAALAPLLAVLAIAPLAQAEFGFTEFDGDVSTADHTPATQAGGHPYSFTTKIALNTHPEPVVFGLPIPDGDLKDVNVALPPGIVGDPNSTAAKCNAEQLVNFLEPCPPASQIGLVRVETWFAQVTGQPGYRPLFNMVPTYGAPATFAFNVVGVPVFLTPRLRSSGDYGITVSSLSNSQALAIDGVDVTVWGTPADPAHDIQRCSLLDAKLQPPICDGWWQGNPELSEPHSGGVNRVAFLRNPTSCTPPGTGLRFDLDADSWQEIGVFKHASFFSHEPAPDQATQVGTTRCDLVPFDPTIESSPTALSAETSSGLHFSLDVPDTGLHNPTGIGQADVHTAVVRLPEGVTINPSQAEGLGVCAEAQYDEEALKADPATGCPSNSKIGTVVVHTPLLTEAIEGDVFIAAPHDNPFDSLLALYVVLRNEERGVLIRQAGEVSTDERTGQITTTFDQIPQLPFSSFDFKFREGARAPLVTPPACGTYTTEAELTPWSAADPEHPTAAEVRHLTSDFQVTSGVGGGPCPSGGLPPFKPGLIAGTLNNNAGSYSPFNLRLFRSDDEQEFTNFSIKLPPGLIGKLAGVRFCPDTAIAAAKARTGAAEQASPSCPPASEVGRTLVGAGVGSVLTYAPGKIYLAGPYNGAPLSIAAITAAKVGPFDLGTVVVREALKINPETAEVFIDPTGSDPLPHIIDGITTHIRDIRAYVDRPEFVLNPTSCDPTSTASTALGSGLDFASAADDVPVTVSSRFQAANCANLGFKPALKLRLIGPTHRSAHPKLRAELRARKGDANIGAAAVTLPKTEFLENAHIRTICTRVQYTAHACPAQSVYGYAKAWTPLLDEPLEGPVYLRSSRHRLPDLVASLDGQIHIDLVGRIDSVDSRIRNTFEAVPDAPVSKFVLTMQGGKKGLLVNNSELCKAKPRADVRFEGQNGKVHAFNPLVKADCGKAKKRAKRRRAAG
jgi:hypothetical protein